MSKKKRRQHGEGSLFQRESDGMWVGRVELGWVNGKRQRKTIYARTQREAVKKLAKAKRAVEEGNRSTANPTVAAWLTTWLDEICPSKPDLRPQSLRNYRSIVKNHIVPAIGNVRMDKFAPQHVRQVHRYATENGGVTSPSMAHTVLSVAMNDARREGLIASNPVTLVHRPAPGTAKRVAFTVDQVRAFFNAIEGDRLASRWHTAFLLGLRQGECLGLRWDSLDLEAGIGDVAWQLQPLPTKHGCGPQEPDGSWPCGRKKKCPSWVFDVPRNADFEYEQLEGSLCLVRPKTAKSTRVIPLPPPLVLSLRERRRLYLQERDGYTTDHGLVWARLDGRPLDDEDDRAQWQEILEAAGIPRADQHSARHTTATLLLELGIPEHVIMTILGHTTATMTRAYAHADLTMQKRAMEQLGSTLLALPSLE